MNNLERIGASFRDPSGFLFKRDGVLYRQVNTSYRKAYDHLISSGLYDVLTASHKIVAHTETNDPPAEPDRAYKVIQPELIPMISYPYEWSFSEMKDAALLTLEVGRMALQKNMILKDASAYNIQFLDGKPILIDTLSFDIYHEGQLWDGYRQFCQHFLAPLALASLVDIRLIQLMRVYIDGIPLDLASELLPGKTKFGTGGLNIHIHMHARAEKRYAQSESLPTAGVKMDKASLLRIYDSLEKTLLSLKWEPAGTEWGNYYNITNYSDDSLKKKGEIVGKFIEEVAPKTAWDLGANNGLFSREASRRGVMTVASDIDPAAVEQNYLAIKHTGEKNLLPLVIDLTNPSAALGWSNAERESFVARGPVDLVLALALLHHLAISNNVPLDSIAELFSELANWAIVEFVPKSDSQVKRLLATRKDIFDQYTVEGFEKAFSAYFTCEKKEPIPNSERILYLLKKK